MTQWFKTGSAGALALALVATALPVVAQNAPADLLPAPSASATPTTSPSPSPTATPAIKPAAPVDEPVLKWKAADAIALHDVIEGIGAEGLLPLDYQPDALADAIKAGEGTALDAQASKSFAWLIEDVRDGRTRMASRQQWFVVDPDVDANPTSAVMARALSTRDIPGAIAGLLPTHPDYAALKTKLAETSVTDKATRNLIRVNLDRHRWLARDLGHFYLLTNVPEFQLRLTVGNEIIRSYRTIVGKPGRTATPSLAEVVEGVVFNPTWTVPQSIVKGEGLGARLLGNPRQAAAEGYKVTRAANGTITVVQQPGARNALGFMKLDMPNEHAIFIHDTPSRGLFNSAFRALSHGCVRTERAIELGMTMAKLGADLDPQDAVKIVSSGKYTRVAMTKTFPVYITYFTMASDISGKMNQFKDIYGRDAAVLAAFAAPRKAWDGKRKSSEAVIRLDNPL